MSTFTPEELTLICLYDPGTRLGAVEELRNMMQYLMDDETELKNADPAGHCKAGSDERRGVQVSIGGNHPRFFPNHQRDRRQSHGHKGTGLREAG